MIDSTFKCRENLLTRQGHKNSPVVQLLFPLPLQESTDGITALHELCPVAPAAVLGVGQCNAVRISAVPGIFSCPDFLWVSRINVSSMPSLG